VNVSRRRVRGIYRKELREYRRNGSIVVGMAVIPLIFLITPLVEIFTVPASSASTLSHEHVLLYMLGIPAVIPGLVAAYSVVGERQQGTLEPVLGTPIRREELLLGKALAALLPSVAIAYAVYALVLALIEIFAKPAVASALIRFPDVLAQFLFTPLLAAWSIWLATAISTRSSDTRVAQQLSTLTALPSVAVTTLIAYNVIHATLNLALAFTALLLLLDGLGWRVVSALFDRERLITGAR
jgi:ABC-type transport system involved in multi-copper enzyme maturation permease subunit